MPVELLLFVQLAFDVGPAWRRTGRRWNLRLVETRNDLPLRLRWIYLGLRQLSRNLRLVQSELRLLGLGLTLRII